VLAVAQACGDRTGLDDPAPGVGSVVGNGSSASGGRADAQTGDVVARPPPRTNGPALRVFVTEASLDPRLGGLAGADAICAKEASDARLSGRFLPWLSDSRSSPATRFGAGGPWARVDGVTVAASWEDLTDGSLDAPINVTAAGKQFVDPGDDSLDLFAWTATGPDGTATHDCGLVSCTCNDWEGTDGLATAGFIMNPPAEPSQWTAAVGHGCPYWTHRLYCFEQ
jgi:hypothetical protein